MSKIELADSLGDFDDLTIYETLEELVGEDNAHKLCRQHGGRTVYIPLKATDGHWLVDAVGKDAAEKVCRHYCVNNSGTRLVLPKGGRNKGQELLPEIARMTDEGMGAGRIAVSLNVHERTVYRIRAKILAARCRRLGEPVQRMLRQGLSADEIAAKLHMPVKGIKPVIAEVENRSRPVIGETAR